MLKEYYTNIEHVHNTQYRIVNRSLHVLQSVNHITFYRVNLGFVSGRWLVPPKPSAAKTWYQTFQEKLPHHFTASYWKNNKPFLLTLYLIIGINIILMVQRAYYFKDFAMLNGYTPNPLYMISRAMGK